MWHAESMEAETATVPLLPGLRDPGNRVSRRAIGYWTARAAVGGLGLLGIEVAVAAGTGFGGWAAIVLPLTAVICAAYVVIMPRWRYRVHRWEVTSDAVYTRAGWITVH